MVIRIGEEHFKDSGFKGWVDVEVPNPVERMSLVASLSLDGNELASTAKQAEALCKLAIERAKTVELSFGEKRFQKLEEIFQYAECNKLLYAIGGIVLNGVPLGKS